MKKAYPVLFLCLAIAGLVSCVANTKRSPMTYFHGSNVPTEYFKILDWSPEAISFEIRVKFNTEQMYHLILDENTPLAEGWFPTSKTGTGIYKVKLETKPGKSLETGKSYRLCIGTESPEAVARYRDNYPCTADYVFTLEAK
ncbi:MAG: hypothetical protein ACYDH0_03325 [Candidatus Aminicenantales bacterium]